MRELTPETITDAVLDQMSTTPDPRLKTIMASAVKHLHAFAREVNLTPAEWIKGIEFMTAAGKMVANATVSIWQTGADGLYDIQASATSVDYRGVFATDADGLYVLRTVKPLGYSIPMDGPVGAMVKAQARHGMRPAHIHFLVGAPGYRELVTALYLR